MVAFHAASCGYFFCVRFPGVLEFPRDIYDDIRDIYILAGDTPHPSPCSYPTSPIQPDLTTRRSDYMRLWRGALSHTRPCMTRGIYGHRIGWNRRTVC